MQMCEGVLARIFEQFLQGPASKEVVYDLGLHQGWDGDIVDLIQTV